MPATKRDSWGTTAGLAASRLFHSLGLHAGLIVTTVVVLATLCGGTYYLWHWVGGQIADDPTYLVTAERIEVTPQPPWIHTDVKEEVLDNLSSAPSIRDKRLAVHVAQAFAMHPWVEQVHRVSKHYPTRMVVDLEYRRPVAMVEVISADGKRGLLPVDAKAVLLQWDGVTAAEARKYPRIRADNTAPAGPIGTAWGDPRVEGGAAVAAVLTAHWHRLKLYRIVATSGPQRNPSAAEPCYELHTRDGSCVIWGRAPGRESSGEPSAVEKVERLAKYVDRSGPLDTGGRSVEIDLRQIRGFRRPKTED